LASDAVQLTFVKAIEQGHTANEESRKAWLFRVAYHEALALRRREATGERVVKRLGAEKRGAEQSGKVTWLDAETPLVRQEQIDAVRAALVTLPLEQQQIVQLRIYDERTFADIAAELGIPLGTALTRMRLALEKLRAALKTT
jgi:RNA polymerase sigma factor (sigma-70 family)